MPPCPMTSPAKMKNGTARSANLSMLPNMVWGITVKGTLTKNASSTITVTSRMRKIGTPRARSVKGSSARVHPTDQSTSGGAGSASTKVRKRHTSTTTMIPKLTGRAP